MGSVQCIFSGLSVIILKQSQQSLNFGLCCADVDEINGRDSVSIEVGMMNIMP